MVYRILVVVAKDTGWHKDALMHVPVTAMEWSDLFEADRLSTWKFWKVTSAMIASVFYRAFNGDRRGGHIE